MFALAYFVVMATAAYLLGLGVAALAAPARAGRFLAGFAATPARHFLELALRLLAGVSLVLIAPDMLFSVAWTLVGWLLVVTTVVLALVP